MRVRPGSYLHLSVSRNGHSNGWTGIRVAFWCNLTCILVKVGRWTKAKVALTSPCTELEKSFACLHAPPKLHQLHFSPSKMVLHC